MYLEVHIPEEPNSEPQVPLARLLRHSSIDSPCSWQRGRQLWELLVKQAEGSSPLFTTLCRYLRWPQETVLRQLLEWHQSKYDALGQVGQTLAVETDLHQQAQLGGTSKSRLLEWPGASHYQKCLLSAFFAEFIFADEHSPCPRCSGISDTLSREFSGQNIRDTSATRSEAMRAVILQRIAWANIEPSLGSRSLTDPIFPPGFSSETFIPWLPPKDRMRPPKYLYDTSQGKTLVVGQDLSEDTPYAAISHSWGQSRIHQSYANIEGIPWRIPMNTRFTIEELKFDLSRLARSPVFCPCRYVWIDLFCIPQDWDDPVWVKIMAEETRNQVAIFCRAEKAMVWIRQVEDWRPVQHALSFIVLRMSQHLSDRTPETNISFGQILETRLQMCNLYADKMPLVSNVQDSRSADSPILNGWFTSLWTLSEYWARPDMVFVNKTWTVLSACPDLDSPYVTAGALGSLGAMLSSMKLESWETIAPAAHNLKRVLVESGIGQIEPVSRASIVLTASHRICSSPRRSRRSQAIMYVCGATEWYGNGEPASTERNMVLGQYPASFLREVASLEGATFFAVIDVEETGFWSIFGPRGSRPLTPEVVSELVSFEMSRVAGTLLPFYSGAAGVGMCTSQKVLAQPLTGAERCDDPWTRSWLIGDDGRIWADQVGILACIDPENGSCNNGNNDIEVTLHFLQYNDLRLFEKTSQTTGARDYLSTLSWWPRPKYAIMLRKGDTASASPMFGIIALELPRQKDGRRSFGKLQHFWCQAEHEVEVTTQDVQWEIF